MKKIINKFKEIAKDNTRLTVFFLVLALFLVIFIVYTIANKYLNYSTESTESYYVYLGDNKVEFEADIISNKKGLINSFKPNRDINFESLPIYSQEKIILPSDMLIALYNDGNYMFYRTHAYSTIKGDDFITVDYINKTEHYFMYDTNNLYLFKDSGTLTIDNKEVNLSPNSYVICTDDKIEYYDYEKDEYVTLDYNKKVIYNSHYYYVNLSEDTIGRTGDLLPRTLRYLSFLKK